MQSFIFLNQCLFSLNLKDSFNISVNDFFNECFSWTFANWDPVVEPIRILFRVEPHPDFTDLDFVNFGHIEKQIFQSEIWIL